MNVSRCALVLALVPTLAFSAEKTMNESPRTISTSGDAEVKVSPDEATLCFGIESFDKDLAKARAENDDRIKKVTAAMKGAGVEEKRISTERISMEPSYSGSWSRGKPVLEGYVVRLNLQVVLRDLSKFDEVLSAALSSGVNQVHSVSFATTELRKHRDEARAMAIRAAQEKAVALAKELGLKPGKARTIEESRGSAYSPYAYWGGRGGGFSQNVSQNATGGGETAGTLSPGMISVSASVNIVFDLE